MFLLWFRTLSFESHSLYRTRLGGSGSCRCALVSFETAALRRFTVDRKPGTSALSGSESRSHGIYTTQRTRITAPSSWSNRLSEGQSEYDTYCEERTNFSWVAHDDSYSLPNPKVLEWPRPKDIAFQQMWPVWAVLGLNSIDQRPITN